MTSTPIIQFGTGRFLQAHVDLFVSEALARGEAAGRITVIQTTKSPESARRVEAFNRQSMFPVRIRGLEAGEVVDRDVTVGSVARAFDLSRDWAAVEDIIVQEAETIVSNTAEGGFRVDPADNIADGRALSFPSKLAKLLHARFRGGGRPITIIPCELFTANGTRLSELVIAAARQGALGRGFEEWLSSSCTWVNSLVDRIVSQALDPIGAVAEPYALWAIQDAPGLTVPCSHPAVVVTGDLRSHERLKLFVLNLGHTYLAERWLADFRPTEETVREIICDSAIVAGLETLYAEEVIPALTGLGLGDSVVAYKQTVLDRFRNPFLDHRLADIAKNHAAKKAIRVGGLIQAVEAAGLPVRQPILQRIARSNIDTRGASD